MPLQRSVGATDGVRKRSVEDAASEFVFGHHNEYRDPVPAQEREFFRRLIPATRRKDPPPVKRPRYLTQKISLELKIDGKQKQNTLANFGKQGARCAECGTQHAGAMPGFVCDDCLADIRAKGDVGAGTMCLAQMLVDIEELRNERSQLADTCHECMGCADAPRIITCNNTDCRVLWDRKQNQSSTEECERRIQTSYLAAIGTRIIEEL